MHDVTGSHANLPVVGDGSQEVWFVAQVGLCAIPAYHGEVVYLEEVSPGTTSSTTHRSNHRIHPGVIVHNGFIYIKLNRFLDVNYFKRFNFN